MSLTDQQIAFLHTNTKEMLEITERQQSDISMSIRRTNQITMIMAVIGILLLLLTLLMFAKFSNSIKHSLNSMQAINSEVSGLRQTMSLVDRSMQSMGTNIEFLTFINDSVVKISDSTGRISQDVDLLQQQTVTIAQDTGALRLNTEYIDQQFGRINYTFAQVSRSVHDAARPSRQFMPVP